MIIALINATAPTGFNAKLSTGLFAAMLALGSQGQAGGCQDNEKPQVFRDLATEILNGDYETFFHEISTPTIVGSRLEYTEKDVSTLSSAFPNGFSDCFAMLDASLNENHSQELTAFFGDGYGLFLYLEAFQLNNTWEIWDYRLSTSFSEVRALID